MQQGTRPFKIPLKGKKQSQETGISQKSSTSRRHGTTSMSQSTFYIIEGSVIVWSYDDSLYSRFKRWKLKCKNTLEAECASYKCTRNIPGLVLGFS